MGLGFQGPPYIDCDFHCSRRRSSETSDCAGLFEAMSVYQPSAVYVRKKELLLIFGLV